MSESEHIIRPAASGRLTKHQREQEILAAAIQFFAEEGFEGQTRALAKRLGMSHSALYRYFPNKEALIERVYETVYLSRWRVEWETLLSDRRAPLRDRLIQFYTAYTEAIFTFEWVRIFIYAGLTSVHINPRYLGLIERHLVRPLCAELRDVAGLPDVTEVPLHGLEMELLWGLHGRIFSMAIQHWVYGTLWPDRAAETLTDAVDGFLLGAPTALRHHWQTA